MIKERVCKGDSGSWVPKSYYESMAVGLLKPMVSFGKSHQQTPLNFMPSVSQRELEMDGKVYTSLLPQKLGSFFMWKTVNAPNSPAGLSSCNSFNEGDFKNQPGRFAVALHCKIVHCKGRDTLKDGPKQGGLPGSE